MNKQTKKEKLEARRKAYNEELFADAYKVFNKFYLDNYIGTKSENSLGPRSRTIRENVFLAGLVLEGEKFWKKRFKIKGPLY